MITISPSPIPASPTRNSHAASTASTTAPDAAQGFGQLWAGDLEAWVTHWGGGNTRANHFKLWLNHCGLRATLLLRISQALYAAQTPFLPGLVSRWNLTLHGLDISPSVSIGPGFYLAHPVGTVVRANSVGANVSLTSSVTIGIGSERPYPTLGANVFVGAGARILGGITIGDNVSVGANAVVIEDVPPDRAVTGVSVCLLPIVNESAPNEPNRCGVVL